MSANNLWSNDIEAGLLGILLLDDDAIIQAIGRLDGPEFHHTAHQAIFHALGAVGVADATLVASHLRSGAPSIGDPGGLLADLVANAPALSNFDHYLNTLLDLYRRRQMTAAFAAGSTATTEASSAAAALEVVQSELDRIGATDNQSRHEAEDAIATLIDRYERAHKGEIEENARPTGIPNLDKLLLGGLTGGRLYVLGARPSMGKSSLAAQIAIDVALRTKKAVHFVSLEMGADEVFSRMVCGESHTPLTEVAEGAISTEGNSAAFMQAAKAIASSSLVVDDNPLQSAQTIRAGAVRTRSTHGELGLIVVDYLQLMNHPDADNETVAIGASSRALKLLTRDLDCPVLVLSQLSRDVDRRTDKRPVMADLRSSGSIEQDADVVMFVYRDEVYEPNSPDRGMAELLVRKNRQGATGVVKDLAWVPKYTKFVPIPVGTARPAPDNNGASPASHDGAPGNKTPIATNDYVDEF